MTSSRRLILVHGFTQTAATWAPLAERLRAEGHQVMAVDLPGHGAAGGQPSGGLWADAEGIGRVGGEGTYVGYSLGGRVCLHLALARPALVPRLVLVSSSAGIDDPGARRRRWQADDERAGLIERGGVEAFLADWLSQPMFELLRPTPVDLEARLANTPTGLASSLRGAGLGTQEPLWGRLGQVTASTLVVAGARDLKFVAEGKRLAAGIARSRFVEIPNAGHACHLEQPVPFFATLHRFLNDQA